MRRSKDRTPAHGTQRGRAARLVAHAALLLGLASGGALVACEGCKSSQPRPAAEASAAIGPPTLRLYLVSDVAGALEPCGCVKDQLGGLDHAAALVRAGRGSAPNAALVAAGPLFFMDPTLRDERRAQEITKAETLAAVLGGLGFVGFAPGRNDWAAGQPELAALASASGGAMLVANASASAGPAPWAGSVVREIGGIKVGFVGASGLDDPKGGGAISGVIVSSAVDAIKREAASVRQQGAQIVIAVGALGRGEAKRIADAVPTLTAVLVGSSSQSGDVNSETPLPERVGDVLIAETGNHLQTIAELDLYVRGADFTFEDGAGLALSAKRQALMRSIDDLRGRIAIWEREGKVAASDIAARKADLASLEAEKVTLDAPAPPAVGSFFRYAIVEVREGVGKDDAVNAQLRAYYKKVNAANKLAFAGKLPPAPAPGEASYVGIDKCTVCHEEARAVWDKTAHSGAYTTLSAQSKEFNLDCVSCHVTGYDRPGGSTVTHVDKLEAVQCEVCHGPGSKHAANPSVAPPVARPSADSCRSCHHPPHVHSFDALAKLPEVLGPGHGRPSQ
jgi:hypothetical protein